MEIRFPIFFPNTEKEKISANDVFLNKDKIFKSTKKVSVKNTYILKLENPIQRRYYQRDISLNWVLPMDIITRVSPEEKLLKDSTLLIEGTANIARPRVVIPKDSKVLVMKMDFEDLSNATILKIM